MGQMLMTYGATAVYPAGGFRNVQNLGPVRLCETFFNVLGC